jgi:hypothetical protein
MAPTRTPVSQPCGGFCLPALRIFSASITDLRKGRSRRVSDTSAALVHDHTKPRDQEISTTILLWPTGPEVYTTQRRLEPSRHLDPNAVDVPPCRPRRTWLEAPFQRDELSP